MESGRHPSRPLFVGFLAAVAATPYPGSYWALAVLSATILLDLAWLRRPLVMSRLVLLVLTWWGLSVTWAVAPSLTVRNGFLIGLVTVAAGLSANASGIEETLKALLTASKVLLVASWTMFLTVPSIGRTQGVYQAGTFEGVFVQRNVTAFFCVVATLSFAVAAGVRPAGVSRGRSILWAAATIGTLLLTASSTGLAVLLASGSVLSLLILASRAVTTVRRRVLVGCALVPVIALALWLPFNLGLVSELFGRDATLTGRSVIWAVVGDAVGREPWLGYGYGALWTAGVPLTDGLWAQAGFAFYHAHSAFWDYLAQVGIVGLVLVISLLLVTAARASRWLISGGGGLAATWPVGITVCLLLYAIDEQSFASQFGWTLAVMAASVTKGATAPVSQTTQVHVTEVLTGTSPRVGSPRPARSSPGRRRSASTGADKNK